MIFNVLDAVPAVLFEKMSLDTGIRCAIVVVVSYLLGSINFGIIFTKIFARRDIRSMGSGNAGATNVMRSVGVLPAILTFVFDFAKAAVAVMFGYFVFKGVKAATPQTMLEYEIYGKYLAGLCVILGHMFPIFFKFKGGKGVVTTFATMLFIQWRVGAIIFVIWLIVVLISRYVSLASMVAAFAYGFVTYIIEYNVNYIPHILDNSYLVSGRLILVSTFCAFAIGFIVIIKHYENIYRLTRHEEKKFSFKKNKDSQTKVEE